MKKRIVIADVHGCYDTLMELIKQFPDDAEIVFVGDLIDRGPKSREVVEFVKSGGYKCVIGNHEVLMLEGTEEFKSGMINGNYETWTFNGGTECIESYTGHEKQFEDHKAWLRTLPYYLTFEYENHKDLLVTHAPSVDYFERLLQYQNELRKPWGDPTLSERDRAAFNMEVDSYFDWMIWHRLPPKEGSDNYFGVSGHNVWNNQTYADPITKCVVSKHRSFASIDTGVCFPEEPFGILSAIEYPSMNIYQQPLIDKVTPARTRAPRTHSW